jgi:hypothetical protein
VGTKQDDGKRFCTLQIAARCSNGTSDLSRRGQPKLSIVFEICQSVSNIYSNILSIAPLLFLFS